MDLVVIEEDRLRELIREEVAQTIKGFINKESAVQVLTLVEAAKYLKISEPTIRRMIREKEIPSFRVRNNIHLRQMDLDAFIRKQISELHISDIQEQQGQKSDDDWPCYPDDQIEMDVDVK